MEEAIIEGIVSALVSGVVGGLAGYIAATIKVNKVKVEMRENLMAEAKGNNVTQANVEKSRNTSIQQSIQGE